MCVVYVGGRRYRGQTFSAPPPPPPGPGDVMRMRAIAPHKAIKTPLSHAAAVDRRALPGTHRTTPFADSALRGKGRHLCACTVAVRAGVRASSIANRLSIVFFVVAVGRGASF